jgi:hypothetical protein
MRRILLQFPVEDDDGDILKSVKGKKVVECCKSNGAGFCFDVIGIWNCEGERYIWFG